ncbi:tRNA uridine(34) 5-carboxymethylaminomethyl modification radical SAM/GNAT enzyme Elp3 [Candidatus Beckwithbacteria bacterium]|nr:tRNA uridine(34) 5-carboxymethylaminomethyl modification radical SAM/GNAT enzyme Elp3 [Candidatus Beckwithbacteria bacterium]
MSNLKELLYQDIIDNIKLFGSWDKTKRRWAKILKRIPRNSEIFEAYNELLSEQKISRNLEIEKSLKIKQIRTQSGVAPFAVMMKPFPCPGNCIYCVQEQGMPKSYMSDEPAAARAKLLAFDPKIQIEARIDQMEKTGHHPEKLQIIVIGGTFGAYPTDYKKEFLKTIFDTCNEMSFEKENPNGRDAINPVSTNKFSCHSRSEFCKEKHQDRESIEIKNSQDLNEQAKYKVIGMSIETRPDWINDEEIKLLREYGVTKVQMGIQAFDDEILKKIKRGHDLKAVRIATAKLRNAGFKINYHFMPNLPGSNPQKDITMAKMMFADPDFRPDTIKIYPCIVLPQTELFVLFQNGEYMPYDDQTLAQTLIEIKQQVPYYCRIDRLIRDITSNWNVAGTKMSNMRQLIQQKMQKQKIKCQCIRCREVRENAKLNSDVKFKMQKYEANQAEEQFLSFEDSKYLYAMLRLRLPKENEMTKVFPVLKNAALIRELQVFGKQIPLTEKTEDGTQHQSLGKKLVQKAEEIAKENDFAKIAIISGVGVRDYYRKLGYKLEETYMVKYL